jgi:hypothetical protein
MKYDVITLQIYIVVLFLQALQQAGHIISEIRETHMWWDFTEGGTLHVISSGKYCKERQIFIIRILFWFKSVVCRS